MKEIGRIARDCTYSGPQQKKACARVIGKVIRKAGHRLNRTLVNYATRYAEAVPIQKIDTETVAEAIVDICSRLGVPKEVLSDQGTQSMSDCMREVCCLLGIKQKVSTPYHPMCNGLVEGFSATLMICLRRLCSEQPRQWHRYIDPPLCLQRGAAEANLFCVVRAALQENHTRHHAHLEGVVDKRDPGARCKVKLQIHL
ncbi:Pol polyprotein [Plakobranchus ocellatus]|uniref:Pol polyprotein n=1 Tax=Plakobranchus ocellatus TaxID=259542 RepID=A0AAV3Z0I8_9GAST|nr:Pol polyprotein [Plakobranchus ocellatus]